MPRKHLAAIATLLLVFVSGARADTEWEVYINEPSPVNAAHVAKLSYSEGAIPGHHVYWRPHLQILRNQLLARDAAAFQLAVRLRKISDGGLLEEFTAMLASTVRAHPTFFLSQIKESEMGDESLKSILLTPGLEYVDLMTARAYEIGQRRTALGAVTDTELSLVRDRCLRLMGVVIAN